MKIAVFDVCDTLYSVNTTFSFLDFYFIRNKRYLLFRKFSKLQIVKIFNYLIYKFLKKDLIRLYATIFLKDKLSSEIQQYSEAFVEQYLVSKIKCTTLSMLQEYKNQGYMIVLMSGSYDFIIKEVAKYFGVNYYYASNLERTNGIYTGKFNDDILLTKYELLQKEFSEIEELIVVSDNKTDLALMKSADRAYAICNKDKDYYYWKQYKDIICIKDF